MDHHGSDHSLTAILSVILSIVVFVSFRFVLSTAALLLRTHIVQSSHTYVSFVIISRNASQFRLPKFCFVSSKLFNFRLPLLLICFCAGLLFFHSLTHSSLPCANCFHTDLHFSISQKIKSQSNNTEQQKRKRRNKNCWRHWKVVYSNRFHVIDE